MISDRNAAITTARQWYYHDPILLDTESTGLDPCAEALELAIIDREGCLLFERRFQPSIQIPAEVTAIHGIGWDDVEPLPGIDHYWQEIREGLRGRLVLGYNLGYDLRILHRSAMQLGLDPTLPVLATGDVMQLYQAFTGADRWISLAKASEMCGLAVDNLHAARVDAELTRRLLLHMACSELEGEAVR